MPCWRLSNRRPMAKRRGPIYWREHAQNWVRSDQTQREYCANNGLRERAYPFPMAGCIRRSTRRAFQLQSQLFLCVDDRHTTASRGFRCIERHVGAAEKIVCRRAWPEARDHHWTRYAPPFWSLLVRQKFLNRQPPHILKSSMRRWGASNAGTVRQRTDCSSNSA
jgi:hypothetical protein